MASDEEIQDQESSVIYEEPIDIQIDEEDEDEEHALDEDEDEDEKDEDEEIEDEEHDIDTAQASEVSSAIGTPIGEHGVFNENEVNLSKIKKRKLADTIGSIKDGKGPADPDSNEVRSDKKEPNDSSIPEGKKVPSHLLEKRRLGRIKAAEAFAKKLKVIGIERVDNKYTQPTGLFQPVMLVNQKNCSSDYLKNNDQVFALRDRKILRNNANISTTVTTSNTPDVTDLKNLNIGGGNCLVDENIAKNDEDITLDDPSSTIVIHPGSKFLKIGFAMDETPFVIPSCIAIPKSAVINNNVGDKPLDREQSPIFNELKSEIQQSFKERMRYYKRKVQSNSYERVTSFNAQSKPDIIEEKTDHGRVEWITTPDRVYYGEEAERCSKENFIVRCPFINGGAFNIQSPYYNSLSEILSDVTRLIEYVLSQEQFNVKQNQFSQYKIVLVIPDIFEKSHVETMFRILLKEMQFQAVAIMQESLAACYGSGIGTSTCIVNIGATQTRIACIDEGTVLENSLVTLDYGGDDITKLFTLLLLQSEFPYQDLDINTTHGWKLVEQLKKETITFEDANLTVQLYNFMKRVPGKKTEKYEYKVFDEVMLAPLALFYPKIFQLIREENDSPSNNTKLEAQLPQSRDIYTEVLNDWRSVSHLQCLNEDLYSGNKDELDILTKALRVNLNIEEFEGLITTELDYRKNYTSLEKAIIQSITNACVTMDISKSNQFYSNIMVVGGSSNIPSLDFILTDRINIWRPRLLGATTFPNFYKNIARQVKDLLATNKANTTPEEEDKIKLSIKELIETELKKYLDGIEAQGGNEHLFPVSVLPPPRDMDPSMLNWKGASVFAQIKLIEELFVTNADWDMFGSRVLQHKCLFTY